MSRLNALACCFFCLLFTGHNRAYASQQNGSDQSTNQGISAESAIKVSDEELAQHFQGKWPILHVDRSQVEKDWPSMTAFDFDVTVSDKGEVVKADFQPGTMGESHGDVVKQAESLILTLHFVPFSQKGRLVFVRSTVNVAILPPEELPTKHVPFPRLADRRTLVMALSRSRCYGYCADYRIRVHGDGRVEYDGYCSVAVTGHHESHLSRAAVDALFEQFRQADLFSLKDRYIEPVMDPPTTEVSISFDRHQKKVIEHVGREIGMPDAVTRLEQALDESTNSKQWIMGQSDTFIEAAKMHPCK